MGCCMGDRKNARGEGKFCTSAALSVQRDMETSVQYSLVFSLCYLTLSALLSGT